MTAPPTRPCDSCGAMIYMATSESSGKALPINAEPAPNGNILLTLRAGVLYARVIKKGEEVDPGRRRWTSHFVDCPQAKAWRRK